MRVPWIRLSFSFLLFVLVVEGGLRLFYVPGLPEYPEALIHRKAEDSVLIYEMRPGAEREYAGVTIRVNDDGFRDDDFGEALARGGRRIVLLGDSIAWGWSVEADQAFPQRLEALLAPENGEGAPPTVLNLAVDGYNTRQEIRLLETRGLGYEPDLVLVAYCLNDPDAFTGGHVRFFDPPLLESVYYAGRALEVARAKWSGLEYHRRLHTWHAERVREELRELGRIGAEAGFPVLLVVIPVLRPPSKPYPFEDIHEFLRTAAGDAGLEFLDLHPALAEETPGALSVDVWHPNAAGHDRIARILAEHLHGDPRLVSGG